jgi:hypothetical protein
MQSASRNLFFAVMGIVSLNLLSGTAIAAISNIRGTISSINGHIVEIKRQDGSVAKVRLAENASIASVAKGSPSDIHPGTFIGTAATPKTDGTLQALEIHIFPESMRGTGEGNRPWDVAPKSSMTNGTVKREPKLANNKVSEVQGDKISVEYNGGSKVVTLTPSTKIVKLVPGNREQLKPNAPVFIPAATPEADGTFEAQRVTVGNDGIAPPM